MGVFPPAQKFEKSPMNRLLLLFLLIAPSGAGAIVIRDDVDEADYRVKASKFAALVDMPGEGHGVLIAPQWVVTAAHAIAWQSEIKAVTIKGVARDVERIEMHEGYRRPPQELLDQALSSWDWTLFRSALASSDDIALVKLAEPVKDVSPVAIHAREDEFGQTVTVFGKGATGDGAKGYEFSDPHRTELRRAENKITSAHGRWLCYVFDAGADALPLEGGSGSGDSGGPVLIKSGKKWSVAGLTSWVDPQSSGRTPGRYGQVSCNVRLTHYRDWIDGVMAADKPAR